MLREAELSDYSKPGSAGDSPPDLGNDLAYVPEAELWDALRRQEVIISRSRARQIALIRELDRRSFERSVSAVELAGQLDLAPETAKALVNTAGATPELSAQMAHMESGEWSFDRGNAVARLIQAGADAETLEKADERDINGVNRLRALTKRIRRRDEAQAFAERHVRSHASLDESVGFISAQLPAHDWKVVTDALDDRADRIPCDRGSMSREQLRADALVAMAMDSLSGVSEGRNQHGRNQNGTGHITVVVDAEQASYTTCESGLSIAGGPRVGPNLVEELMCGGTVEIVLDGISGVPMAVGPSTSVVPPKTRRTVLARDGGCTIDGCWSTYRLEVHHILPRSEGGSHDLENLTTLCWWHHHVQVHGYSGRIDPASPSKRRRIIPSSHDPP